MSLHKSTKEIENELHDLIKECEGAPHAYPIRSASIQWRQNELQGRWTQKMMYISFLISLISIILAGVSIFLSYQAITFTQQSIESSDEWQSNQLEYLDEINQGIKEIIVKPQQESEITGK